MLGERVGLGIPCLCRQEAQSRALWANFSYSMAVLTCPCSLEEEEEACPDVAAQQHITHRETFFPGCTPELFRGWEENKEWICLRT